MGQRYWNKAEEAAGEAYGKKYAERYEKWETLKRTAGWATVLAVVAFIAARTWGPAAWEASRTYLMYGLGALLAFAGCTGLVYAYVRIRRTRRARTYVEW